MRFILLILTFVLSPYAQASDVANQPVCQADLRKLVLPNFKTALNKKDISLEVVENDGGSYKVRLFVGANNPNKQASIGWVVLDVKEATIYDVSRDDANPEKIEADKNEYQKYAETCLGKKMTAEPGIVKSTSLPFAFDKFYRCVLEGKKAGECTNRFHAYKYDDIKKELRGKIDSDVDVVMFLPSIFNLNIILAGRTESDVNIYKLYVFEGARLISKKTVGEMDGVTLINFDISKDYLITLYERKGTILTKIKKVTHFKLERDGKIVACTSKKPTAEQCVESQP